MTRLLDQPLAVVAPLFANERDLSPRSERLLARLAGVMAGVLTASSDEEITRVETAKSATALISAIAELAARHLSADDDLRLAATVKGWSAFANVLDADGGLLTEREVLTSCRIDGATLARWIETKQLLVLRSASGLNFFPLGQFSAPGGFVGLSPHKAIAKIQEMVGDTLSAPELIGLVASPQVMLADAAGAPRTVFDALAVGDADSALDFIERVITASDEGAPLAREGDPGAAVLTWPATSGDRDETEASRLRRV